jgi:hypothetical protein
LPTLATTITPTKNGESPIAGDASVIDPTRISDINPTATPAPASMSTLRRAVHGSPPWSSSSWAGLNKIAGMISATVASRSSSACADAARGSK